MHKSKGEFVHLRGLDTCFGISTIPWVVRQQISLLNLKLSDWAQPFSQMDLLPLGMQTKFYVPTTKKSNLLNSSRRLIGWWSECVSHAFHLPTRFNKTAPRHLDELQLNELLLFKINLIFSTTQNVMMDILRCCIKLGRNSRRLLPV